MADAPLDLLALFAPPEQQKADAPPCAIPEDPADALAFARDAIALWIARDDRILEMRRAYALEQEALKTYEERIAVNDVPILIDKQAEELSRVDLHIQVAPGTPDDRDAAQDIEDCAYWWLREVQSRHTQTLHAGFKYEAAHYLTIDGWLVAECLVDSAESAQDFPWAVRLLDPLNVYPDRDEGVPECVVHRYEVSLAALEQYWGTERVAAAEEQAGVQQRFHQGPLLGGGGGGPATQYRTCYGFYTATHLAVLLEGAGWLKKPVAHGYGRSPLIITVAPGAPWRRSPQADGDDYVPLVGPSFLRAALAVIKDKARIAARVMRMLTKTAAPPHFFATSDPEATAEDIAVDPETVIIGRQGDALTPVVPPPVAFQYASNLLAMEQDQLNRGTVAPPLFGESGSGSGYDRTKQIGTSFSKIETYLELLAYWYETLLRLMLKQFSYFGPPNMTYIARERGTGLRTAANRLNPFDVVGADTRLEVKFGNLLSQDLQAMGMLSATLVDRGIASAEYCLTELLKVDNPLQVLRGARSDQFYKNPENLSLATTWDKMHDTADPIGQQLATMQWPFLVEKWKASLQPPPPQPPAGPPGMAGLPPELLAALGGGGGAPGMGGPPPGLPGTVPLPGSGVPSAALPPGLGPGAGLPPGLMALGPPQVGAGLQSILPPGLRIGQECAMAVFGDANDPNQQTQNPNYYSGVNYTYQPYNVAGTPFGTPTGSYPTTTNVEQNAGLPAPTGATQSPAGGLFKPPAWFEQPGDAVIRAMRMQGMNPASFSPVTRQIIRNAPNLTATLFGRSLGNPDLGQVPDLTNDQLMLGKLGDLLKEGAGGGQVLGGFTPSQMANFSRATAYNLAGGMDNPGLNYAAQILYDPAKAMNLTQSLLYSGLAPQYQTAAAAPLGNLADFYQRLYEQGQGYDRTLIDVLLGAPVYGHAPGTPGVPLPFQSSAWRYNP